jgi:hypothetical protein
MKGNKSKNKKGVHTQNGHHKALKYTAGIGINEQMAQSIMQHCNVTINLLEPTLHSWIISQYKWHYNIELT